MKKSFKTLAVLLAVIMTLTSVSVAASAFDAEQYIPSIIIPGIFQSETKYYENGEVALDADGNPYKSPFFLNTTKEIVGDALVNALIPLSVMLISQNDKDEMAAKAFADVLGRTLMEKSKCDENGHFINDVRAAKYNGSLAELSEYDRNYVLNQIPIQQYVDKAGAENLYFFSYASLGNMNDTAKELYDFIAFVKENSGSDKVNIVPISQGGSLANALLQIYADNNRSVAEDIHRIVYVVPALDGSLLIGEIYQYGLLDDSYELYGTMMPSLIGEDDYLSYLVNIILRIMPNADLNNILDQAVNTLVMDYMRYSTLFWGLVPSGNYEACREMYLSDESTKKIVAQTDWYYGAQLNSDANILNAKADGVEIFDIVDYNEPLYELVDSWDDVNADGIIHLDSTSMGAYSVGVDKLLPDDYVPTCNNCTDPEHHDHTDPNGIVDACTGLLPETTFYFYNQNHEKTASNDIIMKLAAQLLYDNSFTSVFTYPDRFPQFNTGRNGKNFMKDVADMKAYDTSSLSAADKSELQIAIAESERVLDDTTCDLNEFEAARIRFYNIRNKILYGTDAAGGATGETENKTEVAFNTLLLKLLKAMSDILLKLFDGNGFSDITGYGK